MDLLVSVIWIITLTIMGIMNLKTVVEQIYECADGGDFHLGLLILGLVATALCCGAIYVHSAKIVDYGKAPKVTTTTAPIVDTLKTSTGTYYLYEFKDNHYPDIK